MSKVLPAANYGTRWVFIWLAPVVDNVLYLTRKNNEIIIPIKLAVFFTLMVAALSDRHEKNRREKVRIIVYTSGSQTVRRDAPVRCFNFPKASRDNLVLCH